MTHTETKTTFDPSALLNVLRGEKKNTGAAFTVVSHKTGLDYTFKLKRKTFDNVNWYTFVYVERQYLNWLYLGYYKRPFICKKGKHVTTSPAQVAIEWILNRISSGGTIKQATFLHTGNCLKCGRTLTDAASIKYGLGPTCRKNFSNNY